MAVPIFPNSSYFIAFGGSPIFFEEVRLASLRHQARTFVCRSRNEFLESLSMIKEPSGIFLDGMGLSQKDLVLVSTEVAMRKSSAVCYIAEKADNLFAMLPQVRTMLLAAGAKPESWRIGIDEFMTSLTPPKLDEILLNCADAIFPTFFPNLRDFKRVSHSLESADYLLIHSLSAAELIGQFIVRVKWDELCKMFPELAANRAGEKILDTLKEAMNQCAGLLVQTFLRMHPTCNMKIGLSTGFDLVKVPKIQSLKYFPSVHVVDKENRTGISVGFFNLSNQKILDLSQYVSAPSNDNVEFL
jgi:hypothetical protein